MRAGVKTSTSIRSKAKHAPAKRGAAVRKTRHAKTSVLSDRDACLLWGRAGGHCSNPGCRQPVTRFLKSLIIGNAGERAHIVGKKPSAARGDSARSEGLASRIENHILLCPNCHKMVDDHEDQFPEALLLEWKRTHEARVAALLHAGLSAEKTLALHVRARFGAGEGRILSAPPSEMLSATLQAGRFFETIGGSATIDADVFRRDTDDGYWQTAPDEMQGQLAAWAHTHGGLAAIPHLSVFASGPIPVLVALGRLIGDTRPVDVRDFDRDTSTWLWPEPGAKPLDIRVKGPDAPGSATEIRLVVELSGRTDRESQAKALGDRLLPEVLVDIAAPRPGLIRGPLILPPLRRAFQRAFELAKTFVGDGGVIHVFAAMPVSAAVAFGQAQLSKAMPVMHLYDNNVAAAGWRRALTFSHS